MKRSGVDKDSAESICGKLQAITKDDCIKSSVHKDKKTGHKSSDHKDTKTFHKSAVHPKKKTTKVIK